MFVWWFLGLFPYQLLQLQSQVEPGFAWVWCVLLLLQGHCRNKGKVWESQIQPSFPTRFCVQVILCSWSLSLELLWTGSGKILDGPLRWWKYKSQWCCWRRKGKVRIPWQNALKRRNYPCFKCRVLSGAGIIPWGQTRGFSCPREHFCLSASSIH